MHALPLATAAALEGSHEAPGSTMGASRPTEAAKGDDEAEPLCGPSLSTSRAAASWGMQPHSGASPNEPDAVAPPLVAS